MLNEECLTIVDILRGKVIATPYLAGLVKEHLLFCTICPIFAFKIPALITHWTEPYQDKEHNLKCIVCQEHFFNTRTLELLRCYPSIV